MAKTSLGVVLGALLLAAGCTSISATPQPAAVTPSVAPGDSAVPSGGASPVPSDSELPTFEPATLEPTVLPTEPPTISPAPTKTPKPATANLVITKFELDDNYILVETPTNFIVTVKNSGAADAGSFAVSVLETNLGDGSQGQSDPKAVSGGLGAGKSTKVTLAIALPQTGYWKLTAAADSADDLSESNEQDNTADYNAKVLPGLPDVAWAQQGFSMTAQTTPGQFEVTADFINIGTDELAQETAFIGLTWYRDEDGASGELYRLPLTDMAKGEERVLTAMDTLPGSGTYKIYAYLDADHVLNELNYDNNETSIRVTVP